MKMKMNFSKLWKEKKIEAINMAQTNITRVFLMNSNELEPEIEYYKPGDWWVVAISNEIYVK